MNKVKLLLLIFFAHKIKFLRRQLQILTFLRQLSFDVVL